MATHNTDEIPDFAYDGPRAGAPVPMKSTRDIGRPTLPSKATLENVDSFVISHQASAARDLMNLGIITQMKWHPECASRGTDFSYTAILPSVEVWHMLSYQHHLRPVPSAIASLPNADNAESLESPSGGATPDIGPQARIQMLIEDFETSVARVRISVVFPDGHLGLSGDHVHLHFDEKDNTLTVEGTYGVIVPAGDGEKKERFPSQGVFHNID